MLKYKEDELYYAYCEEGKEEGDLFVIVFGDEIGDEEIDVIAKNRNHARKIAEAVIANEYVEGLKIKEIIRG